MVGGSPVNSTAIQLIWQTPDNIGGARVDNYTVSYQAGNGQTISITVSGQATSYTVGNLEPGTEYTFTVSAVNRLGQSTVAMTMVTTLGIIGDHLDLCYVYLLWTASWVHVYGLLSVCYCCQASVAIQLSHLGPYSLLPGNNPFWGMYGRTFLCFKFVLYDCFFVFALSSLSAQVPVPRNQRHSQLVPSLA